MAQKRMFSLQIVDTDAFLEMPMTSQLLYFHLAMRADDEGFVGNPKRVIKMLGASEDDFKILIAKRFVLTFESGVVVIKHWLIHNTIRMDRFNPTNHIDEKKLIGIKSNGAYTEIENCDGIEILKLEKPKKPDWLINRQAVRKESSLPDSFDYKIRQAFIGKPCPICENEMKELRIEELEYNSRPSPLPTIQHNIPISKGGKHELGNISVICRSCNTSIRDKETGELNSKEVIEVWKTIGNQSATQDKLSKVNLSKDKITETSSSKKAKAFYKGEEMRFSKGKWWVLPKDGSEWLEFAGSLKDIEWK
jgi:hypothetical protein